MTVYSFDVFDTCLVREHLQPDHRFLALGRAVLPAGPGGEHAARAAVHEFARARVTAARHATARIVGRDIRLEDIYESFDAQLRQWGLDGAEVSACEVTLERASVRPIRMTQRRIEQLRNAGQRIVFVSDMYLPEAVVRSMLLEQKIAVDEDPVYVSGDRGVTKQSGALFDLVCRTEGVRPADLIHIGDSVEGDLISARTRGVTAELFTAAGPSRLETAAQHAPTDRPGVTDAIAGLIRATRLSIDPDPLLAPEAAALTAGVVAPLLTGFVEWVMRRAEEHGHRTLYFLARDGQVLLNAAQVLGRRHPDLELRYLHGSRQAWSLAAVTDLSPHGLAFATLTGQSTAPRHILARLRLDPEPLTAVLEAAGFPPERWDTQLTETERLRFRELLGDRRILDQVAVHVAEARAAAHGYLAQEGLVGRDDWALVDVGWTLRAQTSLKSILTAAGQDHLHAYYLGISKLRFTHAEYGTAAGYFLEDEERYGTAGNVSSLFENKGLIDQIFTMADHGTTEGYRHDGTRWEPVLAPPPSDPRRAAFQQLVHRTTSQFAGDLVERPHLLDGDELKMVSRAVTAAFISRPRRAEVEAVRWATISDDPNEMRSATLVTTIGPRTIARIARLVARNRAARGAGERTVPVLRKDLSWGFSWVEGSFAVSGPAGWVLASLLRTIRRTYPRRKIIGAAVATTPGIGKIAGRLWFSGARRPPS